MSGGEAPELARVEHALGAMEAAERDLGGAPAPATFEVDDRVAWRADAAGLLSGLKDELPESLVSRRREGVVYPTVAWPSDCVAIVAGKFTRGRQAKARGYLERAGELATLKIWTSPGGQHELGRREREVRRAIAAIPEYRAPALLGEGRIGSVDYLLEPVVRGTYPHKAPQGRVAAAVDLGAALAVAYRRYGVVERSLSQVVHAELSDRLTAVLRDPATPWEEAWGSRERLLGRLHGLVAQDRRLPCSLGHGDLVLTNMIRSADGRHVLVDWEYATDMPVAFDLLKLLLTSKDPMRVNEELREDLAAFGGRGWRRYRWSHQLALGIAQSLSWSPGRRERAEQSGRLEYFDRGQRERLAFLAQLLADD